MTDNDTMTPAQRESCQKAWVLLSEHFDNVLLVLNWELPDNDANGQLQESHEGYWHGGAVTAIGLAEFAKTRILESGRTTSEPV